MKNAVTLAVAALFAFPGMALAAQAVQDVDEPGRNPWQQTQTTQVNTGDCHTGLCVVLFRQVPKGQRLVVTFASALFEGSTALGTGVIDASISNVVPGVPGEVRAQIPDIRVAGKTGTYQAAGPMSLYVDQASGPVMVVEGASGSVRATIVGYLVKLTP